MTIMMKSALITFFGLTILGTIGAWPHCTYVFYYQPVCGNDGKTYINTGHLTCEKLRHRGLEMVSIGHCPTETFHTTGNEGTIWEGNPEKLDDVPHQPPHPEHAFNQDGTQPNNQNPYPDTRSGQMHHGHANYPGNGMGWDNSREYGDNSFELHLGGGHGGGMAKGLIAGAVLGKVASDMSKNKHKMGSGGIGSNPYQQQPNPYAQQPNPYAQQPKPQPVQPNPVAQQPKPYPVQPNSNTNSRPSPYNPYAPSAPAAPAKKPASSGSKSRKTSSRRKGRSAMV